MAPFRLLLAFWLEIASRCHWNYHISVKWNKNVTNKISLITPPHEQQYIFFFLVASNLIVSKSIWTRDCDNVIRDKYFVFDHDEGVDFVTYIHPNAQDKDFYDLG